MSDSRLLLLAALLLLAVFGLCATVWFIARLVVRGLADRWPSTRRILTWSQRAATHTLAWTASAAGVYFVVLFLGFLSTAPWRVESRWRNVAALAALPPLIQRPITVASVSGQLLERLKQRDTLLLVALSGGGSRAAYFSAAMLERLSHVKVPGTDGRTVSLVQRIDVISSVSGGSLAAAYFAAHRPQREDASDLELAQFFAKFKTDMSQDFEGQMAFDVLRVPRTLAFLFRHRTAADALGDVLDRAIFRGTGLRFERLLAQHQAGGPLPIINATLVEDFSLLAFTGDRGIRRPLYPVTERPGARGTRAFLYSAQGTANPPDLRSFEDRFGSLKAFRVADAVAASASHPLLGTVLLGDEFDRDRSGHVVADGGLVDNSGLLSLYAHVLDRHVFEQSEGRLKRIAVIAIDSGGAGPAVAEAPASAGVIDQFAGIYDQAQSNVQRFILPEIVRRAVDQDLAHLLERPGWANFDFEPPLVFQYAACRLRNQPPVGTRFRLTPSQVISLDAAATSCLDDRRIASITHDFRFGRKRAPVYGGVFGPSDEQAWGTLFALAVSQRKWHRLHGQFATIADVRATSMNTVHPLEGRYRATLDFRADLSPEGTGFRFESEISGDRLRLFATPVRYRETGWVSLMVELHADPAPPLSKPADSSPPEAPKTDAERLSAALKGLAEFDRRRNEELRRQERADFDFCLGLTDRFRGGDLGGRRATTTSDSFLPYGIPTRSRCW